MNKLGLHEHSTIAREQRKDSGVSDGFRRKAFDIISTSPVPMTDREVMEALGESYDNNVRPEITRLKQDGLLAECVKTKCAWTGRTVRRTKATGLAYFNRDRSKS